MDKHGIGSKNDSGERLCIFCDSNDLGVTGSLFPHKKYTRISPDGQKRNQIDHILINRKFRDSVRDTKVMRTVDIGSAHRLVRTNIKLKLKK